jgi:general stress protein 26
MTDESKLGWQPTRQELSEFLLGQITCTISTVDSAGKPCGATVAFSETLAGEFIIGTKQLSLKARNLASNPNVALTVASEEKRYTVQLQGLAQPLAPETFEPLSEPHYEKLPFLRALKDDPEQVHFLITPSFLRFSDCSVYPWVLTEYS